MDQEARALTSMDVWHLFAFVQLAAIANLGVVAEIGLVVNGMKAPRPLSQVPLDIYLLLTIGPDAYVKRRGR